MSPSWRPASSWTGEWELPACVNRPVSERGRAALVFLSAQGFGPNRLASALADVRRPEDLARAPRARIDETMQALERAGVRAIVPSDDEYPDDLAAIDAPPVLLYVRGRPLHLLRPTVAIVGARACTSGAARFARKLGEGFASVGFTVVSGLARGIDAAAHRGALEAGPTIAVLGTGLDTCYPAEHKALAEEIVRDGALITEFPLGIGPRAWHFPARNRIIAAISDVLVVVEAGLGSGALITAGFALDGGREVFACTTGPENPAGAGVRELLKDGAKLIVDPIQGVEVVRDALGLPLISVADLKRERSLAHLDADQRRVYDAVNEMTTVEDVASVTSIALPRAAAILTELELDGLLETEAGAWRRA